MINITDITKDYYRTGEVANMVGVKTRTVQNYCTDGKLEEIIINNRRLIPKEAVIGYLREKGLLNENVIARKDIIYARVSTHKQKNRGDLERQINKVKDYVIFQNPVDLEIISEVGSGLNDNRKGLIKLIGMVQNEDVNRIFVNYKDRLTRFGFNYIKLICDHYNTKIIVVSEEENDKTVNEELAEDIVAIIHSFSGKLYGMREKVKEDICKELDDENSNNKGEGENGIS